MPTKPLLHDHNGLTQGKTRLSLHVCLGLMLAAGLIMPGCGSGSASSSSRAIVPAPTPTVTPLPSPTPTPAPASLFLTAGNWNLHGTSANSVSIALNGAGDIRQSGNDVTGFEVTVSDSANCFGPANREHLTGVMSGSTLTLTSSSTAGFISIVLTGSDKQLSGSYQITGGCLNLEHGTADAVFVPSITGTWKGGLTSSTGVITQITATLTQGPSDTSAGFQDFPVSGSVVFSGPTCITTGTVDPAVSFVIGAAVDLQNISDRVPPSPRSINFLTVTNAPDGTTLTGSYDASGGSCAAEKGTVTLVRQ